VILQSMSLRVIALSACLVGSAVALAAGTSTTEPVPERTPLAELPIFIGGFQGARAADLGEDIVAVLGVDDWINRVYRTEQDRRPVGLYIGYYMSQREGEAIHSPMNCLPGAGWLPVAGGPTTVWIDGVERDVNRYIIEKSGERMLVYYWYHAHGRTVASEYWGKIHMVLDAIRLNRTDGALVRVIVPIGHMDQDGEQTADTLGLQFVRDLFPLLERHIPA